MIRVFTGLGLSLLLVASTGCNNKAVVVPTDEAAKKAAKDEPPPPVSFGAPKGNPTKPEGPTGAPPKKVDLKGVGQ